ncbi:hypothetical protein H8E88_07905 [candidate division KSB1 bacterium]|nr:hypothetical protein [candidate division KSB1 bacterium]
MITSTRFSELPGILPNKALSEKSHLLLINENLFQLQEQIHLFSKFESHISAVSNIHDALLLLKYGEYDLIVNDELVLDFNKKRILQIIKKRSSSEPLFIIKAKNLVEKHLIWGNFFADEL